MAMTNIKLTTALGAINTMLGTLGESPVSSLDTPGLVDAVNAKALLEEVTRDTLSRGWNFNTDYDYPIAPDVNGQIVMPNNILSIDTSKEFAHYDVVFRGNKLWDKKRHTFNFPQTIKFDVTWLFGFEEIPETFRHYIAIRASRIFQDRYLGSDTLHAYSQADEDKAWAEMVRQENLSADPSIFDDADVVDIVYRRGH